MFSQCKVQNIRQIMGIKDIVIAYPGGGNMVEETDINKIILQKGKYLM